MSFSDEVSEPPRTISHTAEKVVPPPGEWHTKFSVPLTRPHGSAMDESSAIGSGPRRQAKVYDDALGYVAELKSAAGNLKVGHKHVEMYSAAQYDDSDSDGPSTVLIVFIPILVVILTVLLGVLIFLIAVLIMRRQKGIRLTEDGGPLDLSRGDGVIGEGGVEGVESRWLETADPDVREAYRRTKGEQ